MPALVFVIDSSCLGMYCSVLCCAQYLVFVHVFRSVWMHSFVVNVVVVGIVYIFPFPLIEIISFIVITVHVHVHIVQQISPPIPVLEIESVSEVTHTFYMLYLSPRWRHWISLICALTFNETTKLIGIARLSTKSEISECHAICIGIIKLFNAHTKCVGSCMQ